MDTGAPSSSHTAGVAHAPVQRFSGLRIWLRSSTFMIRNIPILLPIFPLLWVPLVSDLLHGILIREERSGRPLAAGAALREALSALPLFVRLKGYYFARAVAWGLVPLYGMIKDVDERLRWGMASKVIAFEGLRDFGATRTRCEELAAEYRGEGIRALLTAPLLVVLLLFVWIAIATDQSQLAAIVVLFWYLTIPASAAANSYLYVWAAEQSGWQFDRASPDFDGGIHARVP